MGALRKMRRTIEYRELPFVVEPVSGSTAEPIDAFQFAREGLANAQFALDHACRMVNVSLGEMQSWWRGQVKYWTKSVSDWLELVADCGESV